MLRQRIVTAVVLLVIFAAVVFLLPKIFFTLFVALVAFLGAWEWSRLGGVVATSSQWIYASVVGVITLILLLLPFQELIARWISLFALIYWLGVLLLLASQPVRLRSAIADAPVLAAGVFVMSSTAVAMQALHHSTASASAWLLLYALAVVWVMDIGAYFSGKRFGRTKLAPLISPGKTREGVYGGILSAFLLMCLALLLSEALRDNAGRLLAATTLAAFFSVLGDLFESRLKRAADMKDSSQLLPGHGGVLDRIDGVVASLPLFLCIWLWS